MSVAPPPPPPYPPEYQPLLTGENTRAAISDSDFTTKQPPPRYFCRTWTIGIFFGILALGITACMYYWYAWLSIGFTLVLPFTVQYMAPVIFSCCYSGVPTTPEWKPTVRRVAFWGLLFGGVAGCLGGYFGRELFVIRILTPYSNVISTNPPYTDLGLATSFANGALPLNYGVGRSTAFGLYPLCVAPIIETPTQKVVSYWAVGVGACCSPTPANCSGWTTPAGATRLYYLEFYPTLSTAVTDAVNNFNYVPEPNALYVRYGDPNAIQNSLRNLVIICTSVSGGLGIVFMAWRSYHGPY
jgi:hypothetical protein